METFAVESAEVLDGVSVINVPEDLSLSREPRFGLLVIGIGNRREYRHRKASDCVFVKRTINIVI
jgi:hypothetical protein